MNFTILKNTIVNKISEVSNRNGVDNLETNFKKKFSLEERTLQSASIMVKYKNRLPIICNVSKKLPYLSKHKYLIPNDMSSTTFFYVIRKRLKLKPEIALYFFIDDKVLIPSSDMDIIYNKYKDEDGFLYVYVCAENTFG